MLAIINPTAGGGKALARWHRIETRVREITGPVDVVETTSQKELLAAMPALLADGHRDFLAAGGDGTVNGLLAAIVAHAGPQLLTQITVGAVGLGSSNDFHKPWSTVIDGIPCRLDRAHTRPHDVGLVSYEDSQGGARTHFWFVNASIGIAAEANHAFNHPRGPLRFLKRISAAVAIIYAAVAAILTNRPRDLALTIDGRDHGQAPVRNLGFVKNPHFAGSLRYDSPHLPDSGCFHVHRLGTVSRLGLLHALARLARGRFAGGDETRTWLARRATVHNGDGTFLVECDGEVVEARVAHFAILPRKVRLCS